VGITLAIHISPADVDLVAATVDHHRAHGVDRIVLIEPANDAGLRSAIDGALESGAAELVESWAPDGDDWVLDAAGGEFWVPVDRSARLADALRAFPRSVSRIDVPVTRLTGPPADTGAGLSRLVYRDARDEGRLRSLGVPVDPTTRTARRPGPDAPAAQSTVEVLRVGSRSLQQRRAAEGGDPLAAARYLAATPTPEELATGEFETDDRLSDLPAQADTPIEQPTAIEREALRVAVSEQLALSARLAHAEQRAVAAEAALAAQRSRRVVRVADRAGFAVQGVTGRVAGTAASLRSTLERRRVEQTEERRARLVHRLLETPISPVTTVGEPVEGALPIVMCLYNRPARLPEIVRMLALQKTDRPLRLILWNNDTANTELYRRVLKDARRVNLASIDLYESPRNLGGIARFVVARWLWDSGARGPFIMLDDDQNVSPDFVSTLLGEYRPHSIAAWWGFANHGSHWQRSEVEAGDPLDYAGTGGTIADIEIVSEPGYFDLPPRFLMLEDQWMTSRALRRGWDVRKSAVQIAQVMEEESGNQYHALRDRKDEFFDYLHQDAE
jgi:hypothetical protein